MYIVILDGMPICGRRFALCEAVKEVAYWKSVGRQAYALLAWKG